MFSNLLFVTSATEACDPAARVAFGMANYYKARLEILHITGLPTRGFSQVVTDIKSGEEATADDEYLEWVKEDVRIYYETLIENLSGNHRIEVTVGEPHREILRTARSDRPDIIIMGGNTGQITDPAYRRIAGGSTFQRVAGASHTPILVVTRPAACFSVEKGFSRLVFFTDFSKAADVAMEYALEMSAKLECELLLFHPLDIIDITTGKIKSQDEIEEKLEIARRRMDGRYGRKTGDLKNIRLEAREGLTYIEIVKFAREEKADMIIAPYPTGKKSAANSDRVREMEQVMNRAGCPVMVINRLMDVQ